ncbi:MAG: metallophosphoesterase family protein [Deltaproteobacteria bacterium]|nr:metallophosphoesterase family protein [Deltaproteobacteria bacterium]MCB9785807.1 metallophosphoesterase family protein [Deltaproteobacteria bacterium]
MRIAVISDLHLGRRDAADRFGHDDTDFLRFLRFLEQSFERIVLLGDIFETLTSPRPFGHVAELRAARAAHSEISRRFERDCYTFVHGNHDLVAGHVEGAPDELMLRLEGTRVLFTHGHIYDWLVRHARWLSESGAWLGGALLRRGMDPLFRLFNGVDGLLSGVSKNPERCGFQQVAMLSARARDADIVVTGHTHVGVRAEHGDRLFLNSGSCAEGAFSYLAMDTAQGSYSVQRSW